jgi:hypothetical protein
MLRNPMAWGTYMLRSSFVSVFIRFRVLARHHEGLLILIFFSHREHRGHKSLFFCTLLEGISKSLARETSARPQHHD